MNWIKRNRAHLILVPVLMASYCTYVRLVWVKPLATAHAQKPETQGLTWSTNNIATVSSDTAVLYVAKDGRVMFSESGIFDGKDAVATNLHCDPRKEGELEWPWHHCKAERIEKCTNERTQ